MAKSKVNPTPKKPLRDGHGLGERNPQCERNQEGLPRLFKNQKTRPGLGRNRKR